MIKNKTTVGTVMILFAALLWSSNAPFVRWITLGPFAVAAIRSLIAGLVLLFFLRPRQIKWNRYFWGFFICFAALTLGVIVAIKTTSSSIALGMQYTGCIWLFLLAKPKKKDFSIKNIWPMLLLLCGVAVSMFSKADGITPLGNLVAISTSFSFAGMTYFAKKLNCQNPIGLSCVSNLLLAVLTAIIALIFETDSITNLTQIQPVEWAVLLYLGIFQIGMSYALYYSGLRYTSVTTASLLCPLEMILGPVWTAVFLSEIPDTVGLIGFLIVTVGVLGEAVLSVIRHRGAGKTECG